MQILIVDDEALARERLQRMLAELEDCHVIGTAENGDDALGKIEALAPDLVFLDVRMPAKNGIDVAKALADYENPPTVIFCTAYDEYALDAFDTLAQGYIVKPVSLAQLAAVIDKTKRLTRVQTRHLEAEPTLLNTASETTTPQTPQPRRHITVKTHKGVELIPLDDIFSFVADHKYVTVMHTSGEALVDDTLKELEVEFSGVFIRSHRNALVSIAAIQGLSRNDDGHYVLRLKNTDYRPAVSRRHLPLVRELLQRL